MEIEGFAVDDAGFEFGTAGFVFGVGEDVFEDSFYGVECGLARVDGDGSGLAEVEGANVVEAENVISVAVGEKDGVELRDADAEGLVAKIGRGVDDDVFVVIAKPDGGAKAIIAGIGGSADVAIAADGGNADAGTGAEDGEGDQAHFGSWDSGPGISIYFSKGCAGNRN